jgi:hypothetical protein
VQWTIDVNNISRREHLLFIYIAVSDNPFSMFGGIRTEYLLLIKKICLYKPNATDGGSPTLSVPASAADPALSASRHIDNRLRTRVHSIDRNVVGPLVLHSACAPRRTFGFGIGTF